MNIAPIGLVLACVLCGPSLAAEPAKPNLIVIYTDDHGWADLGAGRPARMSARRISTRWRPAGSGPPTATSPRRSACPRARAAHRASSRGASTSIPMAPRWRALTRRPPSPRGCKRPVTPPACPASGTSGRRNRSPRHGFDDVYCNQGARRQGLGELRSRRQSPSRRGGAQSALSPGGQRRRRLRLYQAPSRPAVLLLPRLPARILRWMRRRNTPHVSPARCRNAAGRPWP